MTGPIFPRNYQWLYTISSLSKDVFENLPHRSPSGFQGLKKFSLLYILLQNKQGRIMK